MSVPIECEECGEEIEAVTDDNCCLHCGVKYVFDPTVRQICDADEQENTEKKQVRENNDEEVGEKSQSSLNTQGVSTNQDSTHKEQDSNIQPEDLEQEEDEEEDGGKLLMDKGEVL